MVPGAAGRFLQIAESETAHRRSLEVRQLSVAEKSVSETITLMRWGQRFAFVIAIVGIGAGTFLALHGAEIAGSIFGGGGLATIVLAFLKRPDVATKS